MSEEPAEYRVNTRYNLTLSKKQLQVINLALELYSRTKMGQISEFVYNLPLKEKEPWHDVIMDVSAILRGRLLKDVDGYASHLGIMNELVDESARVSWDMHQVIRHELAWDYAKEQNYIDASGKRNWNMMMGVDYDEPTRLAKNEQLPVIEKAA